MKKSELKDKSLEELNRLLVDLQEELRNIRFTEVLGSIDNPARKRIVRRDIAKVKTVLKEYELEIRK